MYQHFNSVFEITGIRVNVHFTPVSVKGETFYVLTFKDAQHEYMLRMHQYEHRTWSLEPGENYSRFKPYEILFRSALIRQDAASKRKYHICPLLANSLNYTMPI